MSAQPRQFRIQSIIGRGAFGKVYRATQLDDAGFERTVAIKVLLPDRISDDVLRRFRDEARILGLLRDRAIVRVDPPLQLGDRWCVVMEFVDGRSLRQLLKAGLRLPPRPALELVAEVARALDNAGRQPGPDGHPLRLIHRDLKPDNLQLTPGGEVRILDFGIARGDYASRESHTTTALLGTPGYIAPERFDGVEEPISDIYSLGGVLHEALLGGLPGAACDEPDDDPALLLAIDVALAMRRPKSERPDAAQVEQMCLEALDGLPGPSLRAWAAAHVSTSDEMLEDDIVGAVLSEGMPQLAPPPAVIIGADLTGAAPPAERQTLFALLAERGAMPPTMALEVVRQTLMEVRRRRDIGRAPPPLSLDDIGWDGEVIQLLGDGPGPDDPLPSIGQLLVGLTRGYPMGRAYEDPGPLPAPIRAIVDACIGTDIRRAELDELLQAVEEAKRVIESPDATWDEPAAEPPPPPPRPRVPWLLFIATGAAMIVPSFGFLGWGALVANRAASAHDEAAAALERGLAAEAPLYDELRQLGADIGPREDGAATPEEVARVLRAIDVMGARDTHDARVLRQRGDRLSAALQAEQDAANAWIQATERFPGNVAVGLGIARRP